MLGAPASAVATAAAAAMMGFGGTKMVTVELQIPGTKCGLIIGKGGETIKQLQERAGVKMVMIQENNQVTSGYKPLRIIGDPEKIEVCCFFGSIYTNIWHFSLFSTLKD